MQTDLAHAAELLGTEAAEVGVGLAGFTDVARGTIVRGLRGLPGNEELGLAPV